MARRIDKLEVKSRKRPLVDVSVLDQLGASVRYRFKSDGLDGVTALLELHDMGVLELGAADHLRSILDRCDWGEKPHAGHFTNRLAGDDNREYREYFIAHIIPHLEFLRP